MMKRTIGRQKGGFFALLLALSLLLTAGCGKSGDCDWIPQEDRSKPVLMVTVRIKDGQAASARAKVSAGEEQQRELTWDQVAPQKLIYGDKSAAPWQAQLSMPFTVETAVPFIQAVRGWMTEAMPEQTEFGVSFVADDTAKLLDAGRERLEDALIFGRTILCYSLDTGRIATWEGEAAPADLLGYGILSAITTQGEQIFSPIWIVA